MLTPQLRVIEHNLPFDRYQRKDKLVETDKEVIFGDPPITLCRGNLSQWISSCSAVYSSGAVIHSQSFHDSLLAGYDWAGEEFLLYFLARGRWKESETGEDSNNRLWFSISVKSVASKFLRHRPR